VEKTLTPRALGFAMPAEWAPHAATWTAWPYDDEKWLGYLEPVRQEFAAFVNTLARFEPVHLVVNDEESEQDAQARLSGPIHFHHIPHDDLWLRDSGAIFVTRATAAGNEVAAVNWEFNGWGGKYPAQQDNQMPLHMARILGARLFHAGIVMEGGSLEVNGEGVCLTTRQCLRSPQRNPGLDEEALEGYLNQFLGIDHVVWLWDGLEGDHTDGHIDTLTRFTSPHTIVTSVSPDPDDPNHRPLQENLEILRSLLVNSGQRPSVPKGIDHRFSHRGATSAQKPPLAGRQYSLAPHLRQLLHRQRGGAGAHLRRPPRRTGPGNFAAFVPWTRGHRPQKPLPDYRRGQLPLRPPATARR